MQLDTWGIQLMFMDEHANRFILLGCAAWLTREQQLARWDEIPALLEDDFSSIRADLLDFDGSILEDKAVSSEICERLLGKSISQLISEGRRELAKEEAEA